MKGERDIAFEEKKFSKKGSLNTIFSVYNTSNCFDERLNLQRKLNRHRANLIRKGEDQGREGEDQ